MPIQNLQQKRKKELLKKWLIEKAKKKLRMFQKQYSTNLTKLILKIYFSKASSYDNSGNSGLKLLDLFSFKSIN